MLFCRFRQRLILAAPLVASALLVGGVRAEPPATLSAPGATVNTRPTTAHARATSSTALTVASAENANGSGVMLFATVGGASGVAPAGSVVFTAQGKPIGETAVTNGSASLNVRTVPAGLSSFSASYQGDGNLLPSKSATVRFYKDDQD